MLEEVGGNACQMVDINNQMITVKVSNGQDYWLCSAVYASPIPSVRSLLWDYMTNISSNIHYPWFLIGDFNEILCSSEVKGGCFLRH